MMVLASAVRFLHLAASILALGVFAFICFIAWPAARRAEASTLASFTGFLQRQRRLIAASLAVVLLTGLAGLVVQAALMAGQPVSLSGNALAGVFATQFGRVWLLRQVIVLLLFGVLLLLRRHGARPGLLFTGFGLAAALLAALAASGHAAAGEGTSLVVQLAADAVHLLAAGIWLGALIPLVLLLKWCEANDPASTDRVAQEATRRFSWLGMASVSLLLISGLVNAWNLVGGVAPLVGTTYGLLLLTKLAVLALLLTFAAVNLLHVRPRLLSAVAGADAVRGLLTRLKRNALAEAGLGAVVLLLVAGLGVTPPARHVQPVWPFPFRWDWQTNQKLPEKRSLITLGAAVAAGALAPLGYAILRRRHRRWALTVGIAGLGGGAALALPALSVDAYPTTYRRPAVAYQAISVASGLHLYQQHCVACHGIGGYGDGPALQGRKVKRADLTGKHTGDHTAGDLFWWLSHGIAGTPMPGFEATLQEEERWDLINYLRTLSASEQARPIAPLVEPAWLVAPDFAYRTLAGSNKSLKEYRGGKMVLLVLFSWPQSQPRLKQLGDLKRALDSVNAEVIAVPRDAPALPAADALGPVAASIAIDGSQEAFETYSVFRRDLSEQGMLPDPPIAPHMEFLIDRQGYIRARWIASESGGWSNADILLREIAQLDREKPSAPAPDDHVH